MAIKYGWEGKIYRLTTGTRATWGTTGTAPNRSGAAPANLDEIVNVENPQISDPDDALPTGGRGMGRFKGYRHGQTDISVEMTFVVDPSDTDFTALMTAKNTRAVIALAWLDGDKATAGSTGYWGDFIVVKRTRAEPVNGEMRVTFTLVPYGDSAVPPEFVTVA